MALDCILAVRLSAALDCLTPATTGTSRDPKTRRSVTSILQRGVISILRLKRVAYLALRQITARLVAVDRSLWRSGILCGREFRRPTSQQGDRRKRGRTACCGLQSVELDAEPIQTSAAMSFLKKRPEMDDCADMVITMCRTDTVTGRTMVIDPGCYFH
jgi:hypothetical protein